MYFGDDAKRLYQVDFLTAEINPRKNGSEAESKHKHKFVSLQEACRHRTPYKNCKSFK